MTEPLFFTVYGTAAPKGSPKVQMRGKPGHAGNCRLCGALKFPRVLEDTPETARWQKSVALAAKYAMRGRARWNDTPLVVQVTFGFERPTGHYGTGRNAHVLKPSAPIAPSVKPDTDKLLRTTLDGMNGIVFDDDARVVAPQPWKIYVPIGQPEGAAILIREASLAEVQTVAAGYLDQVWFEQPGLRPEAPEPQQTEMTLGSCKH